MSRICRLLGIGIACLAATCMAAAARAKDPKVLTIAPKGTVFQWAVEEATGRIFASLPEDDAVVEFDPASGDEVRRFTVAGNPTELIVKRQWLVAACPKDVALAVIDLKTNKLAGSIRLAGNGPHTLFCSEADNPYLYAVCHLESAVENELFQVDLRKQQIRKRINSHAAGLWGYYPMHVAMSRDGQWISPGNMVGASASGGGLLRVNEEAGTFLSPRDHHPVTPLQIVAGPANRWWTLGNELYPLDMSAPVRKFRGSPVAIHPTLDLAVSLRERSLGVELKHEPGGRHSVVWLGDRALYLETFTDANLILTVPLSADKPAAPRPGSHVVPGRERRPVEELREARKNPARPADPTLRSDLAGNRIVFGLESRAYVVELADLDLKATLQPRLELALPARVSVGMNQTKRIPLSLSSGADLKEIELSVASGPAFAKIEAGDLVLSPTPRDVGAFEVVVRASRGAVASSTKVAVNVGLPTLDFDFTIDGVTADREGKCAPFGEPRGRRRRSATPPRRSATARRANSSCSTSTASRRLPRRRFRPASNWRPSMTSTST